MTESATPTIDETTETRSERRRSAGGHEPPKTTVDKLVNDAEQILREMLPPFETALEVTDYEFPASITIAIKFVPAKPGTETKDGESARIDVSGKLAVPSTKYAHDCSTSAGQLTLFG